MVYAIKSEAYHLLELGFFDAASALTFLLQLDSGDGKEKFSVFNRLFYHILYLMLNHVLQHIPHYIYSNIYFIICANHIIYILMYTLSDILPCILLFMQTVCLLYYIYSTVCILYGV